MKYTVVIKQAIRDEQRSALEGQLTERFGLNAEQAQRLATRRTGRLMKPTSRARAELLLSVFQAAGGDVALEVVKDETTLISEPFQGVATPPTFPGAPSFADDGLLAPPRPTEERADPFGSLPTVAALGDPFLGAPAFPATSPAFREPGRPGGDLLTLERDAFGPPPSADPAPTPPPTAPPVPEVDVWSDFTGALTMTDSTPRAEAQPEPALPAVLPLDADDSRVVRGRRQSLSRSLLLATVPPLALATVLSLVPGALLPSLQRQAVQSQAQTLAGTLGTLLNSANQAVAARQLDRVLQDPGVAFVRIEKPGGTSYLRARDTRVNAAWNKSVAQWTSAHPGGGILNLGGQAYTVTRVAVVADAAGQPTAVVGAAAERSQTGRLIHRVTVGLKDSGGAARLRQTLLLVAASLLSLLVAIVLANRAARAVVQPIRRLVQAADAISMGDLSKPVVVERNDEIGDLALALERMRLSLESALDRLRRRRRE